MDISDQNDQTQWIYIREWGWMMIVHAYIRTIKNGTKNCGRVLCRQHDAGFV